LDTTSVSLLENLRRPGDQAAWNRFTELYAPLLYGWARRLGLQPNDAADLVQDVFAVLVRKLPEFRYDRQRSFRTWLQTVMLNKWRDRQRRPGEKPVEANGAALHNLAVPDAVEEFGEAEYRQTLVKRALQIMKADFQPATWKACWEYVVMDRPAAEVAAELGISVGTVYVAKSRVLNRLRQELRCLLD
jgi:RNA polymerase sigma-70 factor (ECF subfamily)